MRRGHRPGPPRSRLRGRDPNFPPPSSRSSPPAPGRTRRPGGPAGGYGEPSGQRPGSASANNCLKGRPAPSERGHLGPERRLRGLRGPSPATPLELKSLRRDGRAGVAADPALGQVSGRSPPPGLGRAPGARESWKARVLLQVGQVDPIRPEGQWPDSAPSWRERGSHGSQRLMDQIRKGKLGVLQWGPHINFRAVWCPGKKLPLLCCHSTLLKARPPNGMPCNTSCH